MKKYYLSFIISFCVLKIIAQTPCYNQTDSIIVCSGGDYIFPDGTTQINIKSQSTHTSNLKTIVSNCDSVIVTVIDTLRIEPPVWKNVYSTTSYNYLNDVEFTTPLKGIAVGNYGQIVHTMDAGDSWQALTPVTNNDFTDIEFVTPEIAYVCGSKGGLYKTTDGGASWINKTFLPTYNHNELFFLSKDTGYVISYDPTNYSYAAYIHKTTDGGDHWTQLGNLGTTNTMWDVYFVNENVGFITAMGGSRLYKTTDGGANWSVQWIGSTNGTLCITFVTDSIGYVCGHGGLLYKTIDQGNNWTKLSPGTSIDLKELYFINDSVGWVSGYNASDVYFTYDGGNTWSTSTIPTSAYLISPAHLVNRSYGFALATYSANGSIIFRYGKYYSCYEVDIVRACKSYQWMDGKRYNENNDSATYTVTTDYDKLFALNLTIDTANIDVTVNNTSLTANAVNASFKWLDCNNNSSFLVGATNSIYTPTSNGSYAVEVTQNGCIDTSDCINVNLPTGVENLNSQNLFSVYPNPFKDQLTVETPKTAVIIIKDITGIVVYKNHLNSGKTSIDMPYLVSGLYLITITNEEYFITEKYIKY